MRVFIALIAAMALLNAGAAQAAGPRHLVVERQGVTLASLPGGGTMPAWGSTPLEMGNRMPGVALDAFRQNHNIGAVFTWMDSFTLARFSTELIAHDPAYVDIPAIFKLAAVELNVSNLLRLAGAFGPRFMGSYAVPYMPQATLALYEADVGGVTPLFQSHWWVTQGGVLPDQPTANTGGTANGIMGDLYAYDLYLDALLTHESTTQVQAETASRLALVTAGKYMHIVHVQNGEVDKAGLFDVIIVVAAVFAIAESKTTASVTDWLGQVLGQAYADATAEPEIVLPSTYLIDPLFPDDWGTPWDGGWDDNVVCLVGNNAKCGGSGGGQ